MKNGDAVGLKHSAGPDFTVIDDSPYDETYKGNGLWDRSIVDGYVVVGWLDRDGAYRAERIPKHALRVYEP